ncbi:unnamed protein product, partial [marine sediment metagenome]
EIPAAMFLSSGCSVQDVVIEHLKEELTAEETKGQSGWKVYYIDGKVVEMKHFDESGRLYKLENLIICAKNIDWV